MTMENIHIAKLKAGLLDAVEQQFTVNLRTLMRRDVHHDNCFFTLWFLWLSGFRRRLAQPVLAAAAVRVSATGCGDTAVRRAAEQRAVAPGPRAEALPPAVAEAAVQAAAAVPARAVQADAAVVHAAAVPALARAQAEAPDARKAAGTGVEAR